jgi:hypothetical protein
MLDLAGKKSEPRNSRVSKRQGKTKEIVSGHLDGLMRL